MSFIPPFVRYSSKVSLFYLTVLLCSSFSFAQCSTNILVTAAQYCDFLNHTAIIDLDHLYDEEMACDPNAASIARLGTPGGYYYQTIAGRENFPIVYLNEVRKTQYCHWLQIADDYVEDDATLKDLFLASNKSELCVESITAPLTTMNPGDVEGGLGLEEGGVLFNVIEGVLSVAGLKYAREKITAPEMTSPINDHRSNIASGELQKEDDFNRKLSADEWVVNYSQIQEPSAEKDKNRDSFEISRQVRAYNRSSTTSQKAISTRDSFVTRGTKINKQDLSNINSPVKRIKRSSPLRGNLPTDRFTAVLRNASLQQEITDHDDRVQWKVPLVQEALNSVNQQFDQKVFPKDILKQQIFLRQQSYEQYNAIVTAAQEYTAKKRSEYKSAIRQAQKKGKELDSEMYLNNQDLKDNPNVLVEEAVDYFILLAQQHPSQEAILILKAIETEGKLYQQDPLTAIDRVFRPVMK